MGNVWAANNPEKWRAYKTDWATKNPDKIAAYREKWNKKNPEYREKNKERFSARTKKYWKDNRHKMVPQSLLRAARRRARQRGLEFTITVADIVVPETCPLLGIPLFISDGTQSANSPSLDRIDNERGYVPGNVWVISYLANARKGNLGPDDLIKMGVSLREKLDALVEGARYA